MSSTNLTDFRNQFMTVTKGRMLATDLSALTDGQLIVQSVLLSAYDKVNKFDAITPEAIAPLETMTGAELNAYLTDASNRQSFEQVLASAEAMKALATSIGAIAAIAASEKAMTALAASSVARPLLLGSAYYASTMRESAMAIGKMAAGLSGLDPSGYVDVSALAASSVAMSALAASSVAMSALAASSVAMSALAASSVARSALFASVNAMSVLSGSSMAIAKMAAGEAGLTPASWNDMAALAASATAMAALAASATAMSALLSASVARAAIWASATALTAIQNAPSAVLTGLQSHAQVSMMNSNPSALTGTFISGKSMTLLVRNTSGSDTNYLQTLAGGSGSGNDTFTTTTTWMTRVRAYSDLKHYTWSNNYVFQAYVVNMN